MLNAWVVFFTAFFYLLVLFGIASYGDRKRAQRSRRWSPYVYALSLAVYCTTWTFFGSVGVAANGGLNFLGIYVGPTILILVGYPLLRKIVRLSKEERITSTADFLGARYGKNHSVAGVAAIIAVIGTIPYIALQLKAIASSVSILVSQDGGGLHTELPDFLDISLLITSILALFTILFGTRHADATEHQEGLILAIAMESLIKLAAFIAVGVFATWFVFDGIGDLVEKARSHIIVSDLMSRPLISGNFPVLVALSAAVFVLLPRQFHAIVVENHSETELAKARWLFPLYLLAINIFVLPITYAGLIKFGGSVNPDNFVLALPLFNDSALIALLAFIGGLSAGTAMVVVACVALSIMISNDIVLPSYLRYRENRNLEERAQMEGLILNIRRTAILAILIFAFAYYKSANNTAALASIGLISFAAIAQLAPAFFGGLFWRRATAKGAMAAMVLGTIVWAYTLLLPTMLDPQNPIVSRGGFGIELLKPQDLLGLGLTELGNGVFWSLLVNTAAFIIVSLFSKQDALERVQATIFVSFDPRMLSLVRLGKTGTTVTELEKTVSRYLGEERTKRAFSNYWRESGFAPDFDRAVDADVLRFSEQLLASAIGASSSRLVHTLLLKRFDKSSKENIRLLDEASEALKYNQDVLQTALDQLDQGMTVFDRNMRLASWNRQFRSLLSLPPSIGQAGISLTEIAASIIDKNEVDDHEHTANQLADLLLNETEPWLLSLNSSQMIIEVSTSTMPEGGLVVTWNDITDRVLASEALKEANESLERRVEERTKDLMVLNTQLESARHEADQANASKTRFLAATGHDILQPLNAARLYTSALSEKLVHDPNEKLVKNISSSLESVEEILGAILAISRLDAAHHEVKSSRFPIKSILEQMEVEFAPAAAEKDLDLKIMPTSLWTETDQSLLRRLIQNLISNAIKYTRTGRVLVGARRRGNEISIEVWDTGIGIAHEASKEIFSEFKRLEEGAREAPGLGLGLSIVDRIANLLGHRMEFSSKRGSGTRFCILLPTAKADEAAKDQDKITSTSASLTLAGTRVFCIDNDKTILLGMQALLTQWKCIVNTAGNLNDALNEISDDNVPDILLADYHLDNANGLDAIMAIRKAFGEIPAVLVTADRTQELKEEAGKMGVEVLNKPVKPARLRALISHQRKFQSAK